MNHIYRTLAAITVMLAIVIIGCSSEVGSGENQESGGQEASRGEHDRDGSEQNGEEGEESGTELALNETYDKVRNGARLILAYDMQSNSFIGTVENTTEKTLRRIRVEVHLSNGKELGPTMPTTLEPGKKTDVKLTATSKDFDGWTAHPEVGEGEHGGEGEGEHKREGRGEHDREGRRGEELGEHNN